jgi:hypothetical protein
MKTILKFAAIGLLLVGSFASCGKEDENTKWVEAIILDLGEPSVDGCGWAVKINDTVHFPEYLEEDYKQNELKVMIVYENTSQFYNCPGWSSMAYNKIIINQIKK